MPDTQAPRRIVFVTGTRADFGKLKPLMKVVQSRPDLELSVFVTGMHMLAKYGSTWREVQRSGFNDLHPFINQSLTDSMSAVMGKTVLGFTDYVHEMNPDLIVVHGDRVEALACASVGTLTGTLVAHIEGGEVSGTVDELIRHAVTKLSHIHLVANEEAASNLVQLGESPSSIHVIGSPDIDVMESANLPPIEEVLSHYEVPFDQFGILLFHPVTTELESLEADISQVVAAVIESDVPHIVIYPNNDVGSDVILDALQELNGHPNIRLIPSMSFERFLSAMRSAQFVLGNSSAGIREAPHFGVPSINVGSRQAGRLRSSTVFDVPADRDEIVRAIREVISLPHEPVRNYGQGDSAERFGALLDSGELWDTPVQKQFVAI